MASSTVINNISQNIDIDNNETNIIEKLENVYEENITLEKVKKPRAKKQIKAAEDNEKKPIELYPYQMSHKDNIVNILETSPFAFHFSMLGTGNTYTTSYIFKENMQNRFKHLISIAPVSVKSKWKTMENE